jgi:2-phospho-L-lactate guanylyltransferase
VDHNVAVWAVVIARVGGNAKSRLSGVLSPAQRHALALAMLADVVEVCTQSGLAGTLAVVDVLAAREVVERGGALAVADPGAGDMNTAVSAGLRAARRQGATMAIVLPGDVPLISSSDLDALCAAAADAPRAVVVAPAHDGLGTNALLLRPVDIIAPAFGPPSAQRHLALGRAANAHTALCPNLGLALDVDTPADLAALQQTLVRPHTATAMHELAQDHTLVR